ncbi:hypothetical protein LXM50_06680 [Microbacterium sp. Au-Mic1]|uniref:hypothetical protein n=1 Tax=Microbacterium sp. Au-Mic1 TaxID=2906457 RepID=UPI001E472F90|nr:hypothetical protein [Microbacterium sp. Au-Mic1]MCE4025653.1 hypothetical protein [Microbacterium sp. Au-Mic1]
MTDPQQPAPVPPPAAPGYPAPPVAPPAYGAPPVSPSAYGAPQPGLPTGQAPAGAPAYQAPPGAFAGPAGGYTAPYAPPSQPASGAGIGRVALLLALVATVVLTIVGAVLAGMIGHGIGASTDLTNLENRVSADDLSILTPVRDLVLWVEITSWTATALGVWALIQGIVAIARRRGRGPGIAAVVIAAIGPFVYGLVGYVAFVVALGLAASQN